MSEKKPTTFLRECKSLIKRTELTIRRLRKYFHNPCTEPTNLVNACFPSFPGSTRQVICKSAILVPRTRSIFSLSCGANKKAAASRDSPGNVIVPRMRVTSPSAHVSHVIVGEKSDLFTVLDQKCLKRISVQ